jgi:hypothetical protein
LKIKNAGNFLDDKQLQILSLRLICQIVKAKIRQRAEVNGDEKKLGALKRRQEKIVLAGDP